MSANDIEKHITARLRWRAFRLVLPLLNNKQDAEDAVAEAVFHACRGFSGWRGESDFHTWFFAIAKRRAIQIYKQRIRNATIVKAVKKFECQDEWTNPYDAGDLCLSSLSQKSQEALSLMAQYLNLKDAAQASGLTYSCYQSRLHIARQEAKRVTGHIRETGK